MAAKNVIPESEDAKLNMTPMIDMTFLLVVFFMLTIDLSQKEFFPVDLPYASQGVEDKPEEGEIKRAIINITGDGRVIIKGEPFDLSSKDPGEQDDALQQLKDHLRAVVGNDPNKREPDGTSKVPVMIHADLSTKWKYVQWVMQACADKGIKIYKLQFAVKRPPELDEAEKK